jgi:hypothetical protein
MANLSTPTKFILPDGDTVSLIPWEYVLERMQEDLLPIISLLNAENADLKLIDDKLKEWNADNEDT